MEDSKNEAEIEQEMDHALNHDVKPVPEFDLKSDKSSEPDADADLDLDNFELPFKSKSKSIKGRKEKSKQGKGGDGDMVTKTAPFADFHALIDPVNEDVAMFEEEEQLDPEEEAIRKKSSDHSQ